MLTGICGLNGFNRPTKPAFLLSSLETISLRIGWDALEPERDEYTAEPIVRELDKIHDVGKGATVRIAGGKFAPAWLRNYRHPGHNYFTPYQASTKDGWLPIPYSIPHMERFWAMMRNVGPEFRKHPALKLVHVCGPTKAGKMHLVKEREEVEPPVIPY